MADPLPLGTLLVESFGPHQITSTRHAVAKHAVAAGLTGQRLEDFVLSVNELITNAVRHGGGSGRLRLWREDGVLRCEVTDEGEGIPADRRDDPRPPPVTAPGGRGLWIARHLSGGLDIFTGPTGTTVRVSVALA